MSITKDLLKAHLRETGIAAGETVLIHSSMKAIGWVVPGPKAVVEAFLEHLGPEGTLVVPTIISALHGPKPLFDIDKSPSETGLLTEIVRMWPGAARSNHPSHSVAAIGRRATELCSGHREAWGPNNPWGREAFGFGSPWDKLREWNAWVLLIGVDFYNCTLLHHVQTRYKHTHEGETWRTPWPSFQLRKMNRYFQDAGIVQKATLGNAECLLARAADIVETGLKVLSTHGDEIFADPAVVAWQVLRRRIKAEGRPRASTFKANVMPKNLVAEVARPLHMRGLIIDHPKSGRAVHAVWDHGAFFHEDGDPIRQAIADAAHVPVDRVLLTATHTHNTYWSPFFPRPEYRAQLIDQITNPIAEAAGRLEPVRAGWRTLDAPGIRRSRNVFLKDGRAYSVRWAIPSSWHVGEEEILRSNASDDELRILVLERLDGSRLAVCANFSCHNSAALKDPRITDDFFGVAAELVESSEGCTVLMSPGSEGDQEPTAMMNLGEDRDIAYSERLGRRLAGYLMVGLADVPMQDLFGVSSECRTVEIRVRDSWKAKVADSGSAYFEERSRTESVSEVVTSLVIGDYAMVGVPAELHTAPAQDIRSHSPFGITAVMNLTNGDVMYVSESENFFDGSMIYGTEGRTWGEMAAPGSDRVIVGAALDVLRRSKEA